MATFIETQVIDGLFTAEDVKSINDAVMGSEWRLVPDMSYSQAEYPSYGMCHMIKHPDEGVKSDIYWSVSHPIINALIHGKYIETPQEIHFNRAFLQFPLAKTHVKAHNGVHVDLAIPHIAVVYYCNNSDGPTMIFEETYTDGTIVPPKLTPHRYVNPVAGRVAIFDGRRYHCSSQPTERLRCIINFDLIERKNDNTPTT